MKERRIINENTARLFEHAISQALSQAPSQLSDSADDLLTNFNTRMTHIMDNIAPFLKELWIIRKPHGNKIQQLNTTKESVGRQKENGAKPTSISTIKYIKER